MMAGPRKRWKPLQLLIISSLLILTNQIEARQDVQEKLSREPTGLHRLIPDQLLLHNEKDLDAFLVHFDQQTMEDWLQSVSEISPSFRQEVLVLTGNTNSSDDKMRQESSLDPQQRVPVSMKVLSNQSCRSESDSNTEGETGSQNPQTGSGFSGSSQRPDDPIIEFDHQQILMLEDDEVVRTAAASLYEKHPTVSSLYAVDPQQRVQRVKGQPGVLSEHSSLVLVGHGARDHSGEMRISGYSFKDVARIIQSSSRTSQKIQTTTVVACDVGSDQRFREALLKKLHEAGMEMELHLWNAVVQVAETGEVLSQDGAQWRSEDHTKKVVLTVGRNGEIRTRKDDHHRGHIVLTNRRRVLVGEERPLYRDQWPKKPSTFIDPGIYKKVVSILTKSENVDQNHVEWVKNTFRKLEGMTWGLFYPDPPEELQRIIEVQRNPANYLIGRRDEGGNVVWIQDNNEKERVLQRCYVIETWRDIRNIIRHFAKDGEDEDSYLLISDWIFLVKPERLYVHPIGKRLKDGEGANLQNAIRNLIEEQNWQGKERYENIKNHIHESEKESFVTNLRNIFQGTPVYLAFSPEMFVIWYFTASVVSESARNFRTFPLTLMALNLNDNRFWFDDDFITMADGGSWLDTNLRGFSGSAAGKPDKLAALLGREYRMMRKWQQLAVTKKNGEDEFTVMARIAQEYNVLEGTETDAFIEVCRTFLNTA